MGTEKKQNVPKLRFRECAGNWALHRFGTEVTIRRGLTYSPNDVVKAGVRVLRSSNIDEDTLVCSDADDVFVRADAINIEYIKNGDILITAANGSIRLVGKHALIHGIEENIMVHGGFMLLATNAKVPAFINASMSSSWYRNFVDVYVAGGDGSIGNLNQDDLANQFVLFPSLEEQRKIGKTFEQIDNSITLHQRKLSKLQDLKKALLVKMFPAEGESVPAVRFKGYEGAWEQRKLGDIAPLRGGFAFESIKYRTRGIPIIRISNILEDGTVGSDFVYYDQHSPDDVYSLYDGAVLLAMSGATTGKVSILHAPDGCKFYQNQRIGYFIQTGTCSYPFIKAIVKSHLFTNQLSSVLVAGAQPNVSSKEIDSFEFAIPKINEEQYKIGHLLEILDTLITLHQRKLNKLKDIKKALLNEMFPGGDI